MPSLRRIAIAIVAGLIVASYGLAIDSGFGFGHDEACYIGLAKALAAGEGYRFGAVDHAQYPPGFPALLALAIRFVGDDRFVFQVLVTCFGILACGLVVALPSRRVLGLFVGLAWACSAPFHSLVTTTTMAESVFAVSAIGFVAWAIREPIHPVWVDRGIGALLLAGSVMTRSIGVTLLAATIVEWAWRVREAGRWRSPGALRLAIPIFAATLCAVTWFTWTKTREPALYPGSAVPSYVDQFLLADPHFPDSGRATIGDVADRVGVGAITQLAHAVELLTNLEWIVPAWWNIGVVAVAVLLAAGISAVWRNGARIVALAFCLYFLALALWPYDEGVRFLLPIGGLVLWIAVEGFLELQRLAAAVGARRSAFGSVILAIAGLALSGVAPRSLQSLGSAIGWAFVFVSALGVLVGSERVCEAISRSWRPLGFGLAFVFFSLGAVKVGSSVTERLHGEPAPIARGELRAAAEWISHNVQSGETVLATDAAALHVATDRPVFRLPVTGDEAVLARAVEASKARYIVIVEPHKSQYYLPSEPDRLRVLQSRFDLELARDFGSSSIWRVRRQAEHAR